MSKNKEQQFGIKLNEFCIEMVKWSFHDDMPSDIRDKINHFVKIVDEFKELERGYRAARTSAATFQSKYTRLEKKVWDLSRKVEGNCFVAWDRDETNRLISEALKDLVRK